MGFVFMNAMQIDRPGGHQVFRLPQVCAVTGLCRSMVYQPGSPTPISTENKDWASGRRMAGGRRSGVDLYQNPAESPLICGYTETG